ncbi:flagella synthesis protein FlgN [Salinisphaera hydrothermalis]|uniref:flagella synthesis protein FlgN n=1 Tax=Salinisphaera hydrothermalis TaxID=563188 RepID=UPI0033412EE4
MNPAADYADLLARQDAAVQAFVDVLERERDALAARPVAHAALNAATEAKTRQAESLEALERERQRLAEAARAGAGTGLSDAELAQALGCSERWAELCTRVAHARNQNAINGMAIQTRLEHTEERLNFLRRHTSSALYAPDGRRSPSAGAGRLRGGA